jgi:hypothetical protein
LLFYDSGIHSMQALANRARTLKSIESIVLNALARGEIRPVEPPEFIAWLLFSVFQSENRRWLAMEPRDLAEGLSHLWSSVAVILNGLAVKPAPRTPPRALLLSLTALKDR